MGAAERRTRRRNRRGSGRAGGSHAAVTAGERPVGTWDQRVRRDHSAPGRNRHSDGANHRRPGGSSGWHSHPGGAIVVVKTGTLTVYESVGSHCRSTTYTAGQAFIERPGELDDVFNTGTIPYVLLVTFPRVPQGESARTGQPDPGTCALSTPGDNRAASPKAKGAFRRLWQ